MHIHVLNLGGGVQSTTLALMALHGEIAPKPDHVIFANTHWEFPQTEGHVAWLCQLLYQHDIVCHYVSKGDLRAHIVEALIHRNRRADNPPYYLPGTRRAGRLQQKCTREFKTYPIQRHLRTLLGVSPRGKVPATHHVTQWFGISLDEVHRAKESAKPWITHRYPLLLEHRMTRQDCIQWLEAHHYPLPIKSACIGCPNRSDAAYLELQTTRPADWARVVQWDWQLRQLQQTALYMHRSAQPLASLTFTPTVQDTLFAFMDECEGYCFT